MLEGSTLSPCQGNWALAPRVSKTLCACLYRLLCSSPPTSAKQVQKSPSASNFCLCGKVTCSVALLEPGKGSLPLPACAVLGSILLPLQREQRKCSSGLAETTQSVSVPGDVCTNTTPCLQQKFRRVRKMSDDEDDEEEDYGKEEHEKEAIAEEIFQDGEGEEGGEAVEAPVAPPEEEEEEEEDESGEYGWPIASEVCCRTKAQQPS